MPVVSFPKHKRVTLHGKALKKLIEAVYERDKGCCVNCGVHVAEGAKSHHVRFRSRGGGDTENNLVTLCNECHYAVHHKANGKEINDKCQRLLEWLYDEV